MPSDQHERLFAAAFYKLECKILLAWNFSIGCLGFFFVHLFAFLFPNDYNLLFNCYIFFLPPDGLLFAWEFNIIFMTVLSVFPVLFFICYVPLPLLLMNQTCWLLDMASSTAKTMNKNLQPNDGASEQERIKMTNDHIEKFVTRCLKVVEWRNEVQDLLYWNFNLEFQIQALILCLSIYFLSLNFFASLNVHSVFWVCLIQLFIYCWMGTRVTERFDQLSLEISENWHLMTPKQRKTVQMILHWTQNLSGFTGTFKNVSLETFQAVDKTILQKISLYLSFYYWLRSWKRLIRSTLVYDHPGPKLATWNSFFIDYQIEPLFCLKLL